MKPQNLFLKLNHAIIKKQVRASLHLKSIYIGLRCKMHQMPVCPVFCYSQKFHVQFFILIVKY